MTKECNSLRLLCTPLLVIKITNQCKEGHYLMSKQSYNLILFMTDQWRWDTLQPSHICQTPHLDEFSKDAQVFDNAFCTSPLCTPMRGTLMTGLLPHQSRLMDNVAPGFYPNGKLYIGHKTYLERLRDHGYEVNYTGKWHLGHGTLHERGIDNVCYSDGGDAHRGTNKPQSPAPQLQGEVFDPFYGSFKRGVARDEDIVNQAIEQLRAAANKNKPFCNFISLYGPHFPHIVPQKFSDLYQSLETDFVPNNFSEPYSETGKPAMQMHPYWSCHHTEILTQDDWRRTCQHYWAFCTFIDSLFGRVMSTIETLNLVDNTIIAFFTDHGEMLGAHGMFDKGPYFYDETVHIPLMIYDPNQRKPLNRNNFVNLRDLFPTLLELAGQKNILTDSERERSYWQTNDSATYFTYDAYQGREFKLRGVRTATYKYSWSPHDLDELYDLDHDPGERSNVAQKPEYADVKQDLKDRLFRWMRAENDYLLHAAFLPPPGTYVDGRHADEQHDHGWQPLKKVTIESSP